MYISYLIFHNFWSSEKDNNSFYSWLKMSKEKLQRKRRLEFYNKRENCNDRENCDETKAWWEKSKKIGIEI